MGGVGHQRHSLHSCHTEDALFGSHSPRTLSVLPGSVTIQLRSAGISRERSPFPRPCWIQGGSLPSHLESGPEKRIQGEPNRCVQNQREAEKLHHKTNLFRFIHQEQLQHT